MRKNASRAAVIALLLPMIVATPALACPRAMLENHPLNAESILPAQRQWLPK
jgi:hypothetical protein